MDSIIKTPCKVVDKRKTNSWFFGCSYYVTVKLLDNNIINGNVKEFEVTADQYYDMAVGEQFKITLYRHSDGRYYTKPE